MHAHDLIDLADRYLLSRETSPVYARQIRNRTREFVSFADGRLVTTDLLNAFIAQLAVGRRPATVRGYRSAVLSVLRFAGWRPDNVVRTVRVVQERIECFTLAEIQAQLAAAKRMRGVLANGMTNAEFWTLAIHAGYSTALRQADLLAARADRIGDDGSYETDQQKTGKAAVVRFSPEAVALIRKHGYDRAVPWPHSQEHFRVEFKALLIAAGVRRGCWKWLRRSAGTYAELARSGSGHRLLGNTRQIFARHYDASAAIAPQPVTPPRLTPGGPWRRFLAWLRRRGRAA